MFVPKVYYQDMYAHAPIRPDAEVLWSLHAGSRFAATYNKRVSGAGKAGDRRAFFEKTSGFLRVRLVATAIFREKTQGLSGWRPQAW